MFCPNCGQKIDDDSKFCAYCGKSISAIPDSISEPTSYSEPASHPELTPNTEIQDLRNLEMARREANKTIIIGLIWFGIGMGVTWITYSAVAETGGTYTVLYGAAIYGFYLIISGIYHRIFPRRYLSQILKKAQEKAMKSKK